MKNAVISVCVAVMLALCSFAGITAYADETETIDISSAEVVTAYESYAYRFKEIKPNVKVYVTVNEVRTKLNADTDYKVKYSNNINAGTATITVTGKGNYKGTATGTFAITPLSIKSENSSFTANGKLYVGASPSYTIKYKKKLLVENVDYTITAKNIDAVGYKTAVIVIKGKGNFTGTKKFKPSVYPEAVSGLRVASVNNNAVSLSWNASQNKGVSGYRVYETNSSGKSVRLITSTSATSARVTVSTGKTAYFRVCAYVNGKKTVLGDFSNTVSVSTRPGKTVAKYAARVSKKKIVIGWQATSCSGYQIAFSTNKGFKKGVKYVYAKRNKTSRKFKVKKANTNYYVKVRAYTNVGGKKQFGAWSKAYPSDFDKLYEFYSSYYSSNPNRTANLKIASKKINGTIVYPGEVFSFNNTVGPRTAEGGYKAAPIFIGADKMEDGIGGGICQVATTVFNAALYCNFDIIERYQHSQKVTYCPLGRDAAIYWRSEDVKFRNNSKYPVKIRMNCSDGKITCKIFTTGPKKAPKVKLTVDKNGDVYTLKRHVKRGVNYTATSKY